MTIVTWFESVEYKILYTLSGEHIYLPCKTLAGQTATGMYTLHLLNRVQNNMFFTHEGAYLPRTIMSFELPHEASRALPTIYFELQAFYGGACYVPGGSSSQGSGTSTDSVSEEAVMEWFVNALAEYQPGNGGATTETREVQVVLLYV